MNQKFQCSTRALRRHVLKIMLDGFEVTKFSVGFLFQPKRLDTLHSKFFIGTVYPIGHCFRLFCCLGSVCVVSAPPSFGSALVSLCLCRVSRKREEEVGCTHPSTHFQRTCQIFESAHQDLQFGVTQTEPTGVCSENTHSEQGQHSKVLRHLHQR